MNCSFCQQFLTDYPPTPNRNIFYECNYCKSHFQYANGNLIASRTRFQIDESSGFLFQYPNDKKAILHFEHKFIDVPWEVAAIINSNNIQKRLKTFLTCLIFL